MNIRDNVYQSVLSNISISYELYKYTDVTVGIMLFVVISISSRVAKAYFRAEPSHGWYSFFSLDSAI